MAPSGTFGRERKFSPAVKACWIEKPAAAKGHQKRGDRGAKDEFCEAKPPLVLGRPPSWAVLRELVPDMMKKEVMKVAEQSLWNGCAGVVVIEMLWSNTLPSHEGGRKYQQLFHKLQEILADKNLAVASMRPPRQAAMEIYDRNSLHDKELQLLPSNQSYLHAGPSRLGAFEVHLVQPGWDADKRCGNRASGTAHRGPPMVVRGAVWCEACAVRLVQSGWDAEKHCGNRDPRMEHQGPAVVVRGAFWCEACATNSQQVEGEMDEMDESCDSGDEHDGFLQHTLLHSKLWARSFPSSDLLPQIAGVLMPKWPADAPPLELDLQVEEPEVPPLSPASRALLLPFRRRVAIPSHSGVDSQAKLQELHDLLRDLAPLAVGRDTRDQPSQAVKVKELLVQQSVTSPCTVTLLWGLDGKLDQSDLDLSTKVGDDTLFYGKREIGKCKLDFDHQGRGTTDQDCAENLSLGQLGSFPITVTNFANNDGDVPIPFTLLVRRSGRTAESYHGEVMHGLPVTVCTIQVAEKDLIFSSQSSKSSAKRSNKCEDAFKVAVIDGMTSLGYDRPSCLDWFAEWSDKDIEDLHLEYLAFEELTEIQADLEPQVKRQQQKTIKRMRLAQHAFIVYCRTLIECVPDHGLDLRHMYPALSKKTEPNLDCSTAIQSVQQACEINDRRRRIWKRWEASVEPWLKDLSPSQVSRITGAKTSEEWRMDEMKTAREELQKYVDFDDGKPMVRCPKLQHLLEKWQEAMRKYRNSTI